MGIEGSAIAEVGIQFQNDSALAKAKITASSADDYVTINKNLAISNTILFKNTTTNGQISYDDTQFNIYKPVQIRDGTSISKLSAVADGLKSSTNLLIANADTKIIFQNSNGTRDFIVSQNGGDQLVLNGGL